MSKKETLQNVRGFRASRDAWKQRTQEFLRRSRNNEGKPGVEPTDDDGEFYRIIVRPSEQFVDCRTLNVTPDSHIQIVTGKRTSGSWSTHAWLIHVDDAKVEDGRLKGVSKQAKNLLKGLRLAPSQINGIVFQAQEDKEFAYTDG